MINSPNPKFDDFLRRTTLPKQMIGSKCPWDEFWPPESALVPTVVHQLMTVFIGQACKRVALKAWTGTAGWHHWHLCHQQEQGSSSSFHSSLSLQLAVVRFPTSYVLGTWASRQPSRRVIMPGVINDRKDITGERSHVVVSRLASVPPLWPTENDWQHAPAPSCWGEQCNIDLVNAGGQSQHRKLHQWRTCAVWLRSSPCITHGVHAFPMASTATDVGNVEKVHGWSIMVCSDSQSWRNPSELFASHMSQRPECLTKHLHTEHLVGCVSNVFHRFEIAKSLDTQMSRGFFHTSHCLFDWLIRF